MVSLRLTLLFAHLSLLRAWTSQQLPIRTAAFKTPSRSVLSMAGFGGNDAPKKETKLKPKQQWDRYLSLKKDEKISVAVRATDTEEWLEVGNVKSKANEFSDIAVARQRALIADHARRLFPLKVSPKDKVEWAVKEGKDWKIVDKAVLEGSELPSGIEKLIGFEGKPDPGTGYYCFYNEGKLVNSGEDVPAPSSKKLQ